MSDVLYARLCISYVLADPADQDIYILTRPVYAFLGYETITNFKYEI